MSAETHANAMSRVKVEVFTRRIMRVTAGTKRRDVTVLLAIAAVVPAQPIYNRFNECWIEWANRLHGMYGLRGDARFFGLPQRPITHWQQRLKVSKGVVMVSEINHMA